jgi:5-methylcytosine-specific restriction endonuclease McrA
VNRAAQQGPGSTEEPTKAFNDHAKPHAVEPRNSGDAGSEQPIEKTGVRMPVPNSAIDESQLRAQDIGRASRRHIPNEVRRAVVLRDGEQCTYVSDDGRRCTSRAFLQLHHVRAHAIGGPSTFENLRLLCGAHNRLLAEQDFGRAHQERRVTQRSSKIVATRSKEA